MGEGEDPTSQKRNISYIYTGALNCVYRSSNSTQKTHNDLINKILEIRQQQSMFLSSGGGKQTTANEETAFEN